MALEKPGEFFLLLCGHHVLYLIVCLVQVISGGISPAPAPNLIVAPVAMSSPSGTAASPERGRMVTVLPRSPLVPAQHGGQVVSARPVAPVGQSVNFATRSPGKVTVLSLPKTSSVPAQFVTVVPSTGSGTTVSTAGLNNKPAAALPYKVLIRPPTAAVSVIYCNGCCCCY